MSLLGVLNNYNKGNYKLSPVVVQEQDYNVYYGGISNGEFLILAKRDLKKLDFFISV